MAGWNVRVGGRSESKVFLDYSYQFPLSCLCLFSLKEKFNHKGDCWQLETKKAATPTGCNDYVECQLVLVTRGSEKPKSARICLSKSSQVDALAEASPEFQFLQEGDTSGLVTLKAGHSAYDVHVTVEVVTQGEVVSTKAPIQPLDLTNDVVKLYDDEDFGDTTVVAASGKKFRCHRDFLTRRSPYWARMFNTQMKEAGGSPVPMEYEDDVVCAVLLFINGGTLGGFGPIADRIYPAAHQYELDGLKILCEFAMAANLSATSVLKVFRLATSYRLDKLSATCARYTENHRDELPIADMFMAIAGWNEVQMNVE